jgi:S1-C subfamily serine protease
MATASPGDPDALKESGWPPPPADQGTGRSPMNGAQADRGANRRTGRRGQDPEAKPSPERPRQASTLRRRILPRSVLGIACLILALAVGAGFSGVVLYSYYQYQLNQTNNHVNALVSGYKKQFANAQSDLAAATAAAKASIQNQLKALQQIQAGPATLAALIRQVAPSVYFVHTHDANGQASVGTAFVVSSTATQSLLLTSYSTVRAATVTPGPTVYIQQGSTSTPVTVRSWDPEYDLALLVLPQGGLHALHAATLSPAPQPGDGIYAVSGLGSAGASISQGAIIDVSASGITESAAMGPAFQGGPLINQAGDVVAVASLTYAPYNFTSSGVWFAPYVEAACNKVLDCPNGTLAGSQ